MPAVNISASVRERIESLPQERAFTPRSFLDLGGRAAIDKALSRLAESGTIARVARGVYAKPKASRFFGEVLPAASEVARVIAEANGERISVHGAEAARELGLTTQMPVRNVFLTSGRSRQRKVAGSVVEFQHSKAAGLRASGTTAGLGIAAMLYLGKDRVTPEVVQGIRKRLTEREWKRLEDELPHLPSWVATAVHGARKRAGRRHDR